MTRYRVLTAALIVLTARFFSSEKLIIGRYTRNLYGG